MENTENKTDKPSSLKIMYGIFSLIIACGFIWSCNGINREIVDDEIEQYEMCIRNNDLIGASVSAGVISELYKMDGDEEGYKKWKAIDDDLMKKEEDKSNKELEKEMNQIDDEYNNEMNQIDDEYNNEMDQIDNE